MSIIVTIIVGFLVGLIARAIMPGNQAMGWIMTTILGIVGSLVASYGGAALGLYRLVRPWAGSPRSSAPSSCCSCTAWSPRKVEAARRSRHAGAPLATPNLA